MDEINVVHRERHAGPDIIGQLTAILDTQGFSETNKLFDGAVQEYFMGAKVFFTVGSVVLVLIESTYCLGISIGPKKMMQCGRKKHRKIYSSPSAPLHPQPDGETRPRAHRQPAPTAAGFRTNEDGTSLKASQQPHHTSHINSAHTDFAYPEP
ncbi:hypothetical protein RvY_15316 [Ramazzottius varieornatus]|uniref:Uncharacterized protein n=1 Tax=Ramazzottius varieornatus TaxID=947166 RepID=A0A1D1VUI0_RAMVA|nr:hypothetical protein RvY_15316 [Ramazzottius varieornatus]